MTTSTITTLSTTTTTTPPPTTTTAEPTTTTLQSTTTAEVGGVQWAYATGDGGKNAVCRPQQSEGLIHYGVTSLSDCKVLCENEAGCWGVEFSHAAAHCEMWDIPITGIENFPGSVCLQRTAS